MELAGRLQFWEDNDRSSLQGLIPASYIVEFAQAIVRRSSIGVAALEATTGHVPCITCTHGCGLFIKSNVFFQQ